MENPAEDEEADGGAKRIQQNIPDAALAGRDKMLMGFVGNGVERGDGPGGAGKGPSPGLGTGASGPGENAPGEPGEDGVFDDVRGFTHDQLEFADGLCGDFGFEPSEDGTDDA